MWKRVAAALLIVACALTAGATSLQPQAQGQPKAAQDEFVPVDDLPSQEELPAAPLVLIAYAAAWVVILAYLWSIWQRLGRVERELRDVTGRIESGRSAARPAADRQAR